MVSMSDPNLIPWEFVPLFPFGLKNEVLAINKNMSKFFDIESISFRISVVFWKYFWKERSDRSHSLDFRSESFHEKVQRAQNLIGLIGQYVADDIFRLNR